MYSSIYTAVQKYFVCKIFIEINIFTQQGSIKFNKCQSKTFKILQNNFYNFSVHKRILKKCTRVSRKKC